MKLFVSYYEIDRGTKHIGNACIGTNAENITEEVIREIEKALTYGKKTKKILLLNIQKIEG